MLKILTLALTAATLALSACILVPVGDGHDNRRSGDRGSHEHRGDRDGDRHEHDDGDHHD